MSTFVGGICSTCCHMALVLAFTHLYSILFLSILLVFVRSVLFLSILFYNFFKSGYGIETPNFICHFVMRAIPMRLTFGF